MPILISHAQYTLLLPLVLLLTVLYYHHHQAQPASLCTHTDDDDVPPNTVIPAHNPHACPCTRPLPLRTGPSQVMSLLTGHPPPTGSYVGPSYCNSFTDRLGSGQNVLSYSYYTPPHMVNSSTIPVDSSRYLELLEQLLSDMASFYPGWRLRLYHNVTYKEPQVWTFLCTLYCSHPHLDLCNTRQIYRH